MRNKILARICTLSLVLLLGVLSACGSPAAPAPAAPSAAPAEAPAALPEMALRFQTTALDGREVDESILAEGTVTMINFFEPWCPPCVAELGELEALYENYRDAGFRIVGVFSTEEGVTEVLANAGTTYPTLRYVPAFDEFQTDYVPTTVFLDAQGRQLGDTVIGARSYGDWEEIVRQLLP